MAPLTTRQRVVQSPPPDDLDGFPVRHHQEAVYRAARQVPWWFCRCGDCRFDIDSDATNGFGTLYAGTDPVTGVLETVGPEMAERPITRTFLAERIVWMLAYDRALVLADLCHDTAIGFGVTNELSTIVPYDVPRTWATVFADHGLDGISYRTRFSTGAAATGVALFDEAGDHDWVAEVYARADDDEMVAALRARHIHVDDVPTSAAMDLIA